MVQEIFEFLQKLLDEGHEAFDYREHKPTHHTFSIGFKDTEKNALFGSYDDWKTCRNEVYAKLIQVINKMEKAGKYEISKKWEGGKLFWFISKGDRLLVSIRHEKEADFNANKLTSDVLVRLHVEPGNEHYPTDFAEKFSQLVAASKQRRLRESRKKSVAERRPSPGVLPRGGKK